MLRILKNTSANERRILLVIALNLIIVVAESIAGVIGGSLALLSDAWHNLSDVLALVVTAVALWTQSRPASNEMTYGYVRSEMMASFINALFLSVLMVWVGVEAVNRLLHPVVVDGWLTMIVAAVALVVNTASAIILGGHSHAHSHGGEEEEHDLNITSAFWHMASDAILSLAVVLGGLAMMLWGVMWVDALLSIVFAVVILRVSLKILKTSFLSLMDKSNPVILEELSNILLSHPDVKGAHDVHLSCPSSHERYFSAHIVLDDEMSLKEVECVIDELRHKLSHAGATHVMLQPETSKYLNVESGMLCDTHMHCSHSH
jgi:cobalt-zinc-cadmium efflux system protein